MTSANEKGIEHKVGKSNEYSKRSNNRCTNFNKTILIPITELIEKSWNQCEGD